MENGPAPAPVALPLPQEEGLTQIDDLSTVRTTNEEPLQLRALADIHDTGSEVFAGPPAMRPRVRAPEEEPEGSEISTSLQFFEGYSFKKFSKDMDATFWDKESTGSTALDIIAVYLKGQKILYVEAKTYCEQHLNTLMLPAIFISVACTVLSSALDSYGWGAILVSSLTAFNSFVLTLISFLKLDAKAEAHKTSSYQFDKLQALCEFHSGKVLFFKNNNPQEIINIVEKRVSEIKDNNQFIIPEAVRYRFPIIYGTNVFTKVKKIENDEVCLKNQLTAVMSELGKLQRGGQKGQEKCLADLEKSKKELLDKCLSLRNEYLKLDEEFNKEINDQIAAAAKSRCWNPLSWLKT